MCSIRLTRAHIHAALFPRTARYQGAGNEFGRLAPLSRVVIHFISFTGKLKME
jgi:hypothetical protein